MEYDDARRYLEGVDYPAGKGDVAAAAEGEGAPEELVERIRALPTPEFSGVEQVLEDLRASPGAG